MHELGLKPGSEPPVSPYKDGLLYHPGSYESIFASPSYEVRTEFSTQKHELLWKSSQKGNTGLPGVGDEV